jgi:preprotein translocase subunit SecA
MDSLFSAAPVSAGLRPEKPDRIESALDGAARAIFAPILRMIRSSVRCEDIVSLVDSHDRSVHTISASELKAEAQALGSKIRIAGFQPPPIGRLFAIIRETALRTIGQRHFRVQLMGGWALLNGAIAEMETGEGKTLAATLPVCAAALAGFPVHVICPNDYLTSRDAAAMGPIFKAFGLTVGCVTHELAHHERKAAYSCHITYCTNKEIAFDYLRDKISLGQMTSHLRLQGEQLYAPQGRADRLLLRGLYFAVCDEADSLLIDEARTPLIISGSGMSKDEEEFLRQALAIASELKKGIDFSLSRREHRVELKDEGIGKISEAAARLGPLWSASILRDDTIRKALSALHLYMADIHYMKKDGAIQIIDEYTGRLMPDRSWEDGIHQLIEIKEDCPLTNRHTPVARITYQRFFRRYLHLCGMTGTASDARKELWNVYNLAVIPIPTEKPMRRKRLPDTILPSLDEKFFAIKERIENLHRLGRPVLAGTRFVETSEILSALLTDVGLDHSVLNARSEQVEAAIVAKAGQRVRITVATNMAGRGTDIVLGEGVAALGGLHVILTERHDAARIDRQLNGRCGRQGDPGSFEAILSLEDPLVRDSKTNILRWTALHILRPRTYLWTLAARGAIRLAQRRMSRLHERIRRDLLKHDKKMGTLLSFTGKME